MHNEQFLSGFLKAAQENGFNEEDAVALAKSAGLFDWAGNVVKDTLWEPIKGIGSNATEMFSQFGKGKIMNGFGSGAKMLGNAGLTALNFLPGAGLGSLAIRGGLRGAGALARGAGNMMASRAATGAGQVAANTAVKGAVQAAAPAATTAATGAVGGTVVKPTVATNLMNSGQLSAGEAAAAARGMQQRKLMQAPSPVATPPPVATPLPGSSLPTPGSGMTNFGNKLTGMAEKYNTNASAAGNHLMGYADSAAGRLGAGATNTFNRLRGTIGAARPPYPAPISGAVAKMPGMLQVGLPASVGFTGWGHYAGLRDERERTIAYMNQPGMEPLSTYETEYNLPY